MKYKTFKKYGWAKLPIEFMVDFLEHLGPFGTIEDHLGPY